MTSSTTTGAMASGADAVEVLAQKLHAASPSAPMLYWENLWHKAQENYRAMAKAAIEHAALAAPAPVVPEEVRAKDGWIADEPTPEMYAAARDWSKGKYGMPIGNEAARGCWQAMLWHAPVDLCALAATPSKPVGDGAANRICHCTLSGQIEDVSSGVCEVCDGPEASAPPAGGGDDEPLTSTDAVRHWEAEQAMAAGEPVTSAHALALDRIPHAGGGADPWAALRKIAALRWSDAGEPFDDALDIADAALAAAPAAPEPAAGGDYPPGIVNMLSADNRAMRAAGTKLAEAALRVIREYDGCHRLSLAVAEWSKALGDEGGRGERYAADPTPANAGAEGGQA